MVDWCGNLCVPFLISCILTTNLVIDAQIIALEISEYSLSNAVLDVVILVLQRKLSGFGVQTSHIMA
jgi:hypothetical protein